MGATIAWAVLGLLLLVATIGGYRGAELNIAKIHELESRLATANQEIEGADKILWERQKQLEDCRQKQQEPPPEGGS